MCSRLGLFDEASLADRRWLALYHDELNVSNSPDYSELEADGMLSHLLRAFIVLCLQRKFEDAQKMCESIETNFDLNNNLGNKSDHIRHCAKSLSHISDVLRESVVAQQLRDSTVSSSDKSLLSEDHFKSQIETLNAAYKLSQNRVLELEEECKLNALLAQEDHLCLNSRIQELTLACSSLENQLYRSDESHSDQVRNSEAQMADFQASLSQLQQEIEGYRTQNEQLKSSAATDLLKLKEHQEQIGVLQCRCEELDRLLDENRTSLMDSQDTIRSLVEQQSQQVSSNETAAAHEETIRKLELTASTLRQQVQSRDSEISVLQQQLNVLVSQLEQSDQPTEIEDTLETDFNVSVSDFDSKLSAFMMILDVAKLSSSRDTEAFTKSGTSFDANPDMFSKLLSERR